MDPENPAIVYSKYKFSSIALLKLTIVNNSIGSVLQFTLISHGDVFGGLPEVNANWVHSVSFMIAPLLKLPSVENFKNKLPR